MAIGILDWECKRIVFEDFMIEEDASNVLNRFSCCNAIKECCYCIARERKMQGRILA